MTFIRCPRCEAAVVDGMAALSRTTRDDGAPIKVCNRCGQRESLYGRDPAGQVAFGNWPVAVETLLAEERALIEMFRASQFAMLAADQLSTDEDAA